MTLCNASRFDCFFYYVYPNYSIINELFYHLYLVILCM